MKKSLVLKFLLLGGAVFFLCQNAEAGLFDSIASQVTQAVTKQQQNSQTEQQQQAITAQRQAAQQKAQAAQQQAEQQQAQQNASEQAAQQQYKAQQQQAVTQQQQQQQADQQAEQVAADALAKRPPLKVKFDDFNWGDGLLATKTKLAFKGKNVQESGTATLFYSGQYVQVRGKFLTYNDTVFDSSCTITLGFSIKTEKLSDVSIQFADNSIFDTLNNALTKKYGSLEQGSSTWGGVKKGEDSLRLTADMTTSSNGIELEYVSGEDMPLLAAESDEVTNANINHDSEKL